MTLAVLFDFNGVLVDDEDVHFEAFRRTLAVLDVTISHHVYRRFLGYDDRGHDRRAARALRPHGRRRRRRAGARSSRTSRTCTRGSRAGTRGSVSARARWCGRCATAGARLAIVSGARRAEIDAVLDACALRDSFDAVIAAEDVTRGKPDPECYRLALARLEAAAGRAAGRGRHRGRARRACARRARPGSAASASPPPVRRRARTARTRSSSSLAALDPALARLPRRGRRGRCRSCSRPARCACRRRSRARSPIRPATTTARTRSARCAPSIERDVIALLGIRDPAAYHATVLTTTGTGANEACLLALAGLGPGPDRGEWLLRRAPGRAGGAQRHRAPRARAPRPIARWIRQTSIARWRPRPSCAGCTSSATRRARASRTR